MSEYATNSGGIHPGKPVIWPSSKTIQTNQQSQVETSQGEEVAKTTQIQAASTTETQAPAQAAVIKALPTIARALTTNDIRAHLLSLQFVDSDANMKLASLMLKSGIELSRENISKALLLIEGTDKSLPLQESALVMISKGLDASPVALQALSSQFTQNPDISNQLSSAKAAMTNMMNSITSNPAMFSSTLLAQITALISQFTSMVDDLPKKYKFSGSDNPTISRDGLIDDIRGLKALLSGIESKINSSGQDMDKGMDLMKTGISETVSKLGKLFNNLFSQVLLSQKSSQETLGKQDYLYYQVPNGMTTPPTSVDIMIKQDGSKKATIDPRNTKIVIGLETEALGKIAVALTVKNKNVKFMFNTQLDETKKLVDQESKSLRGKMYNKGYNVESIQSKTNPSMCTIKPYLIPDFDLDSLFRIDKVI